MKKQLSVFAFALAVCLMFVSCTTVPEKSLLPDDHGGDAIDTLGPYDEDYKLEFSVSDANADDYYLYGTNAGEYISVSTGSDGNGDSWNEHIAFRSGAVNLTAGIYRFSLTSCLTLSYSSGVTDSMVLQIRIFDNKTDAVLGLKELYWSDYAERNVMQNDTLDFVLWEDNEVRAEIRFIDSLPMRIGGVSLEAVSKTDYDPYGLSGYFAETEGDKNLTYDPDALYYFDMTSFMGKVKDSVFSYDTALMIFCLQGLVNRDSQRLYIRFTADSWRGSNVDATWLEYLQSNGKLDGKTKVTVSSPACLLRLFADFYQGFVLWDNAVPATENVACTACAVDGYLPLRYLSIDGSLYRLLLADYGLGDSVKMTLVDQFQDGTEGEITVDGITFTSTSSAKNDAYLWAKAKYLDTHRTNQTVIAYHVDAYTWDKTGLAPSYLQLTNCMLSNKDYYIQNGCFFFDLNPMSYLPNDDLTQNEGEDKNTFELILRAQNEYADGEITVLGGFCPWYIKYCTEAPNQPSNSRIATQVEWSLAQMIGKYYLAKDADAYGYTYLTNASVFSSLYDGTETYTQGLDVNGDVKNDDSAIAQRAAAYIENGRVKAANYVCVYMGDYDAGAWINLSMYSNFSNGSAKKYPLAWPVNPVGMSRVPHVTEFMYENATAYDYFVGDHNGYGYIDLEYIGTDSSLNGNLDDYFALSKSAWERFDLDLMGFVINTTGGLLSNSDIMTRLADLAPYGIATNNVSLSKTGKYVTDSSGNKVGLSNTADASNSLTTTNAMLNYLIDEPDEAYFMCFRHVLATVDYINGQLDALVSNTSYNVQVVDPYVYFYLMTYNK